MKNKILLSAFCLFTFSSAFHSQETKTEGVEQAQQSIDELLEGAEAI